ncbi:MAG: type II secretion system protein [Polyangiaceae bacterium]
MRGRPGQRGYTLIEIMTVIAIMALLMSIVMYGYMRYRTRAYYEGTKGLLDAIEAGLEQYKSDFGEYPPDGFDPKHPAMRVLEGSNTPQQIRGSACLLYYLGSRLLKEVEVGEEVEWKRVGPYMDFKESQVSGFGDMNQKLLDPRNEVLDALGHPIHYQRVTVDPTTGKPFIVDQTPASVHTMPGLDAQTMHGPDPRRGPGGLVSKKEGAYDLWSHGADVTDTTDDITNWQE